MTPGVNWEMSPFLWFALSLLSGCGRCLRVLTEPTGFRLAEVLGRCKLLSHLRLVLLGRNDGVLCFEFLLLSLDHIPQRVVTFPFGLIELVFNRLELAICPRSQTQVVLHGRPQEPEDQSSVFGRSAGLDGSFTRSTCIAFTGMARKQRR